MKRKFYIVLEKENDGGYSVYIPELSKATCGDNLDDAFYMAYDCACGIICCYEDENIPIPLQDFDINKVKSNQLIGIIDVDTEDYRKKVLNNDKKLLKVSVNYSYLVWYRHQDQQHHLKLQQQFFLHYS